MAWQDWIQPGVVVAAVIGVGTWQAAAVGALREDVAALAGTVHALDVRLAVVETRLDGMDRRLGQVEVRLDRMEARQVALSGAQTQ